MTLSIRLLVCALCIARAAGEIKLDVDITPRILGERFNNTMDFTVSCTAKETSYHYRRYGRGSSRILSRLRILVETEFTWQPMAQISNLEPSLVFVDPAFPNVNSVGTISSDLLSKESGLAVKWAGPTLDAVKRFRCDAITFDGTYSDSGTYHWDETKIAAANVNSYSLAQLSSLEKNSFLNKIDVISAELDESNSALMTQTNTTISASRAEVGEILTRVKFRLEEIKKSQAERLERMLESLTDLLTQTLVNQTREVENVESTLETATKGSFLMLWPKGTYAIPKPSTGCPSTGGQVWVDGFRRHHTESIQRNEDETSPGNHLQQPVLNRRGEKFFAYQRFCVQTRGDTFGPAWPNGTYCINAVRRCPADFQTGYVTWDEEDFRSEATIHGELPSGSFEASSTRFDYCCRHDGQADEPVHMPRFQPFYLYRYKGKCQEVVGMNVSEEYIHFDTENSNNGDEKSGNHPDVELNDLILHLCYYE